MKNAKMISVVVGWFVAFCPALIHAAVRAIQIMEDECDKSPLF